MQKQQNSQIATNKVLMNYLYFELASKLSSTGYKLGNKHQQDTAFRQFKAMFIQYKFRKYSL